MILHAAPVLPWWGALLLFWLAFNIVVPVVLYLRKKDETPVSGSSR
jgi:hypothetical protein